MTVLDSHAVFVYLEKEPGYEKVRDALARAAHSGTSLLMTAINWGEIFYITKRENGLAQAEEILKTLETFPIDIIEIDKTLAKQAAHYKADKKMSYADCFAAALAKQKKADLLTGDPEFKEVEKEIKIIWL